MFSTGGTAPGAWSESALHGGTGRNRRCHQRIVSGRAIPVKPCSILLAPNATEPYGTPLPGGPCSGLACVPPELMFVGVLLLGAAVILAPEITLPAIGVGGLVGATA